MSEVAFITIAALTLMAALAAALFSRLIHAALAFAFAFLGVAAIFFLLGAEFVGLVQVFVYIGAVAILIVFTILLTRRDSDRERGFNWSGVLVALAVFFALVWSISKGTSGPDGSTTTAVATLTVKQIGETLMKDYSWPLLGVGVLLTVALLGALILAMEEKE